MNNKIEKINSEIDVLKKEYKQPSNNERYKKRNRRFKK